MKSRIKGQLSLSQAAPRIKRDDGRFGVSHWTIRKLILRGLLQAHKIGGHWYIEPSEIERFNQTIRKRGKPTIARRREHQNFRKVRNWVREITELPHDRATVPMPEDLRRGLEIVKEWEQADGNSEY